MKAELESDDAVSITIIHKEKHMVRGCLVLAGDHLIHLGGVENQTDYLNVGQQMDNARILKLNKEECPTHVNKIIFLLLERNWEYRELEEVFL